MAVANANVRPFRQKIAIDVIEKKHDQINIHSAQRR